MRLSTITIASALLLLSCTKSTEELKHDDRAKLDAIIGEDLRASKAMAEADRAVREGNVTVALDAVDHRAQPAIEAGLRLTAAAEPKTDWGRARRDAFVQVLEARRAELPPYRDAVKSGDPEKLIAAIEAQARIERRAITAAAEAREAR
ncbi:MAG: hypothetical protein K0S65_1884 [Labilithrix sp.]|nr:hypothetical protein [Labilithrix sp.]